MTTAVPSHDTTERTILVVDDDAAIRDTLAYNLRAEGYHVVTAGDGLGAMEAAANGPVSLVLLDLMLPRLDGLEVCRRLRAQSSTSAIPILMLTARGEETDKVVGLELGADDYVTKPFSWIEVRARVRALLRRSDQTAAPASQSDSQGGDRMLVAGDITIDLDRREVRKSGQAIEMQARLFDLLVFMVRHRGKVLTRDQVLSSVWEYEYTNDTRTIDVHIRWLREKLEDDPANPQMIQTVRGVGYRFK
jgi:DNA-binding response OmpR family regulator